MEMNFQTYVYATVEYYRTIEAYRKLLLEGSPSPPVTHSSR